MESTSIAKIILYVTVSNWIGGFFGIIFAAISAKSSAASVQDLKQKKRLTVSVWITLICFIGAFSGHTLLANPWIIVEVFSKSETTQPSPSPCVTDVSSSPISTPQEPHASSTSRQSESSSRSNGSFGTSFAIDSINYDSSRFPVQVRFPIRYQVEPNAAVRITIPSPLYRVTGRSSAVGARIITYMRAGINTYPELHKVFYGQRGTADWSDWVRVDVEVPPGRELTAGRPIEMVIPRVTNGALSNKGLIIQMKSVLSSSGEELYPSCAISNGRVF